MAAADRKPGADQWTNAAGAGFAKPLSDTYSFGSQSPSSDWAAAQTHYAPSAPDPSFLRATKILRALLNMGLDLAPTPSNLVQQAASAALAPGRLVQQCLEDAYAGKINPYDLGPEATDKMVSDAMTLAGYAGGSSIPFPQRGALGAFGGKLQMDDAPAPTTYLYQKLGPNGEHLKCGITNNPDTRYTEEGLGGGSLRIIGSGSRQQMLELERKLHETLPIGPEEGQDFYIQKQIEKGLRPPPYK